MAQGAIVTAGKRTADAAYDRTGYANVADKFVTCVQREGSHSITSDDCDNLLSLLAQCAALREALRRAVQIRRNMYGAGTWTDKDVRVSWEAWDNDARAALAIVDGAE